MKERLRHTKNYKLTNNMTSNSQMEFLVWNSIIFSYLIGSLLRFSDNKSKSSEIWLLIFDLMKFSHIIFVRIDQKISIILQTIKSTKIFCRLETFLLFSDFLVLELFKTKSELRHTQTHLKVLNIYKFCFWLNNYLSIVTSFIIISNTG